MNSLQFVIQTIGKDVRFGTNSLTLLDDFEKLENGHYKLFGKIMSNFIT